MVDLPPEVHRASFYAMIVLLGFEVVGISQVSPYIDMMVSDIMNVERGDPQVAAWVPLVVGTYNLSEALAAALWGKLADRWGFRPTLIISIGGDIFTTLLFGFSKSLGFAVAARFLDGCFCGNSTVAMAWLGSSCDKNNDTVIMVWPSTAMALGLIVGPLLGSTLAEPAVWAPSVFKGTVFEMFPFLLPNFLFAVCKVVLLLAVVFTFQAPAHQSTDRSKVTGRPRIPMSPTLIRLIVATSLSYGFSVARTQCYVVLVSLPERVRGLAMTELDIGIILMLSAIALVVFNVTIYDRIVVRLGPHRAVVLGSALAFAIMFAIPLTGLTADPERFGPWRCVPIGIWQISIGPISTMVTINGATLINREAPSSHKGAIMGQFQALRSLCSGLLMYVGGGMMDVGLYLESHYSAPGGRYLAFYLLSSICAFNMYTIFKIGVPSKLDAEEYQSLADVPAEGSSKDAA